MIDDDKKRKGWVRLHRSLCDSDIWFLEPFTKAQAWVDLIVNANHAPQTIMIRGIVIDVQRGQIAWSEITMAKRWKWSRNKVRRFLDFLEKTEKTKHQNGNITTIITICNYDIYQSGDTADDTADDTAEGQQKDSKRYTNKNDKNDKNEKKSNKGAEIPLLLNTPEFVIAWESFLKMRKEMKKPMTQTAQEKSMEKLLTLGHDRAIEALRHSTENNYQGIFEPRTNQPAQRRKGESTSDMHDRGF